MCVQGVCVYTRFVAMHGVGDTKGLKEKFNNNNKKNAYTWACIITPLNTVNHFVPNNLRPESQGGRPHTKTILDATIIIYIVENIINVLYTYIIRYSHNNMNSHW